MGGVAGPASGGAVRTHHHALRAICTALSADEEAFLTKLGLDPAAVRHMMRHGRLPAQTAGKGN